MMAATEIKKKPHSNLLVLNIELTIIGYVQYQDPGASVLCNQYEFNENGSSSLVHDGFLSLGRSISKLLDPTQCCTK